MFAAFRALKTFRYIFNFRGSYRIENSSRSVPRISHISIRTNILNIFKLAEYVQDKSIFPPRDSRGDNW